MSHASILHAISEKELDKHGSLEKAVEWNMAPFNENGHCFRKGSRWDWYEIGGRYNGRLLGKNVLRVSELNLEAYKVQQKNKATKSYIEAQAKSEDIRDLVYGIKAGETLEQYLERELAAPISFYAFMRSRHWNEGERLGWFGCPTATECEVKTKKKPRRCVTKHPKLKGARIITWMEPWEQWSLNYYERFVKLLAPETTLVVVDYHV